MPGSEMARCSVSTSGRLSSSAPWRRMLRDRLKAAASRLRLSSQRGPARNLQAVDIARTGALPEGGQFLKGVQATGGAACQKGGVQRPGRSADQNLEREDFGRRRPAAAAWLQSPAAHPPGRRCALRRPSAPAHASARPRGPWRHSGRCPHSWLPMLKAVGVPQPRKSPLMHRLQTKYLHRRTANSTPQDKSGLSVSE